MTAKSPVVLVLGAGSNIGQAIARHFGAKGFKVALAARSLKEADSTDDELNIPSDFSSTDDVVNAFTKAKKVFGIPSVVVYNASTVTWTPADDPFAISVSDLERDTTVNIHSAFVAAQQAVQGFAQLPESAARAFIYTGNITNVALLPRFLTQAIGKSGGASMIWTASAAYKDKGYKFYYADERKADGSAKYRIDGDAHANLYWELAHGKTQGPWMQTFVDGKYREFDSQYRSHA